MNMKRVIKIIRDTPEMFDIPEELEPNESFDGDTFYGFTFVTVSARVPFYFQEITNQFNYPLTFLT
jgi:hypothetical protein